MLTRRPTVRRYGFIYLSVATVLGSVCVTLPLVAIARLVFAWLALGFLQVATAYFACSPRLLGKRLDGTLAPWAMAIGLPVYCLNYGFRWGQRRFGGEPASTEVAPGLFVGRRPGPDELPEGTTTIVDLSAELSAHARVRAHPGYLCFPMLDDGFPEPGEIERIVVALQDVPGPMLIHCAAGHGRSATLAAAVGLARGQFRDLTHAETSMRRARPKIRFTTWQRERLEQWYRG